MSFVSREGALPKRMVGSGRSDPILSRHQSWAHPLSQQDLTVIWDVPTRGLIVSGWKQGEELWLQTIK